MSPQAPIVRLFVALFCWVFAITSAAQTSSQETLKEGKLGSTRNVHSFGNILLCGQPSAGDFAEAKRRGIDTVITLRQPSEIDWDEAAAIESLDLDFHQLSFASPDTLSDNVFDQAIELMGKDREPNVLLHCGSANRVGAIWIVHRVINDGISVEAAVEEAKEVGLRTPGYQEKALDYVKRKRKSPGQKPGINDRFKAAELDVGEWLARFEIESREVYAARERVLEICEIKPGDTVADIGAGTGFYSRLFAQAVGKTGTVFSVDIASDFLKDINEQAAAEGITNITSVLCTDRTVVLPPNSVDVAFVCDTYHHFEHPESTLASIHRALKPGGTLVVIDFERIIGKSRDFVIGHVRAGKDVFQSEIIQAGFHFVEEIEVPEFKENYLIRFRKAT